MQVSDWLGKVFGDESIPCYEVNPRTTQILQQLKIRNEKQDEFSLLQTQDYLQKADEYAAESRSSTEAYHTYTCFICES